jgi:hypothetical protein
MLWLANIRQKISETEFDEIQLVKWFDQSPAQGPATRSSLRARTLVPPSFPPPSRIYLPLVMGSVWSSHH